MEESLLLDALNNEDKVEENGSVKPVLEVSVSFGKFENELLAWEKWSTFSPNKYLEEVEKCATPGSVAMKRAYFEAHYKKIADRKTKLLEQERELEGNVTVSNELEGGGVVEDGRERVDFVSEMSNHHASAEDVEASTALIGEVGSVCQEVVKDDVESTAESESLPDGEKEELNGTLDSVGSEFEISKQEGKLDCVGSESEIRKQEGKLDCVGSESEIRKQEGKLDCVGSESEIRKQEGKLDCVGSESEISIQEGKLDCFGSEISKLEGKLECADSEISKQEEVVVKEVVETPPTVDSRTISESQQKLVDKISTVSKFKKQVLQPNRLKESKKTTPAIKERNSASVKKKLVSSTVKAPQISTPKLSKTTPGPTTPAARSTVLRSSVNKGSNSTPLKSRNPSSFESKKVAPKSLHMSLSLGTPNSDPSSGTGLRRSFIMEKMGDKDIVKRAFKTFQNSFNQMKSSPQEEKFSAPKLVPSKEKETRISTSMAAKTAKEGLNKVSGTIRGTGSGTARVAPSQKLEEKPKTKVAGRTNLQSKSKVAPSQKVEEKFNVRERGRMNLLSKSKDASKNGL